MTQQGDAGTGHLRMTPVAPGGGVGLRLTVYGVESLTDDRDGGCSVRRCSVVSERRGGGGDQAGSLDRRADTD